MSSHAWIITHVNTKELGEDMADEVGIMGPRDASDTALHALKAGLGVTFRMLDDDGIWYYRGKLWFPGILPPVISKYSEPANNYYICAGMGGDEIEEFSPLNDFGTPNAGATTIEYRVDTAEGRVWAIL